MCMNNPTGITGDGERERSIRGRRAGGGGSASGRASTGMAKGAEDLSGREGAIPRAGSTSGARRETMEEALNTDTLGAKEMEGPRASKDEAGGESPEDDGPNPCPPIGCLSRREEKGI
jgi:hypothetical protein